MAEQGNSAEWILCYVLSVEIKPARGLEKIRY